MVLSCRPVLLAFLAVAVTADAQGSREGRPSQPRDDLKSQVELQMRQCMRDARDRAAKRDCRRQARAQFQRAAGDMQAPERETYFQKFERDAARELAQEQFRECLGQGATEQSQRRACVQQKISLLDSDLSYFLEDEEVQGGEEGQRREGWRRHLETEARGEVIANTVANCFKTQSRSGQYVDRRTAMRTCKENAADELSASALGESADAILEKHWTRKLMAPAEECDSELATCRRQARQAALDSGMERRRYVVTRQMAEVKAGAVVWASCRMSAQAEDVCDDMAREEFLRVSGTSAEEFTDKMRRKVRNLGRAIFDGRPIHVVRRKRMLVSAVTDGLECNRTVMGLFAAKALNVSKEAESTVGDIVEQTCRMSERAPEYAVLIGTDLSDERIANLSSAVVVALDGYSVTSRRLGEDEPSLERRLESLAEVFAAQDLAECGEADAACAAGDPPSDFAPSPSLGPASGAARTAAAAGLGLAAVLRL